MEEKGILRYRGYPIEQLAEKSDFLEVAYLLNKGELPTQAQLTAFANDIKANQKIDASFKTLLDGMAKDAHPMAVLASLVAALNGFQP